MQNQNDSSRKQPDYSLILRPSTYASPYPPILTYSDRFFFASYDQGGLEAPPPPPPPPPPPLPFNGEENPFCLIVSEERRKKLNSSQGHVLLRPLGPFLLCNLHRIRISFPRRSPIDPNNSFVKKVWVKSVSFHRKPGFSFLSFQRETQ